MAILRNRLTSRAATRLCVVACISVAASVGNGQTKNSCLDCHAALPDPLGVTQEKFSQDIHAQKGLTCVSCHGGDQASDEPDKAMSTKAGWKGKIERKQIPQLCGSCHSDPVLIRQFNPSLRTDQLAQYNTSVHGKRLAAGDTKVAVCTDCHSVHDVRAPSDPRSTVNPVNVANTCARCHADPNYMTEYSIPTDQFAKYSGSVHQQALMVRGDLSAPTCPTCHGNHGAAPPGVDKVQNVCSNCHAFQDQMYEKSTHKKAFQEASLPGCVVCHGNHGITYPTDAKLGTGPDAVCMRCHTPGDKCDQARAGLQASLIRLEQAIQNADQALGLAERSGMEVSEARLAQDQARDSLTKARVTIHSFRTDLVDQDVQAGLRTAAQNLRAGQEAMVERNRRRAGLGVSLVAIGMVLVGLRQYLKKIEG
ncbi:MAG TPA: cytochrome c3 family protein [Candidatus Sulfotelmatobacter sp.]|nr:cytochrome c3 family protein [Candidatus Sulfotelmatobacter sp.]